MALLSIVVVICILSIHLTAIKPPNNKPIPARLPRTLSQSETFKKYDTSELKDLAKAIHLRFKDAHLYTGKIGFGYIMGYCSGLSIRKISTSAAVIIGAFFVALQTMEYLGYVRVDMEKFSKDVDRMLDRNKDKKVDMLDAYAVFDDIYPVLAYQLPSSSGFAVGLINGWRA